MARFILEAEPDELAGAVDVETLLDAVVRAMAADSGRVNAALGDGDRARIKVLPGDAIADVARACGQTCERQGLFVSPRLILVVRLDWRPLLAHELTHLVRYVLGGPSSESEANRIEDHF